MQNICNIYPHPPILLFPSILRKEKIKFKKSFNNPPMYFHVFYFRFPDYRNTGAIPKFWKAAINPLRSYPQTNKTRWESVRPLGAAGGVADYSFFFGRVDRELLGENGTEGWEWVMNLVGMDGFRSHWIMVEENEGERLRKMIYGLVLN